MNKQIKSMNADEDYLARTSQRDLAAGVLKQAAQDLRRFHGATTAIERELYFDAYQWVTSHDVSGPFSFLNVCQLLGRAPEALREDLIGDAASGLFSYWTRRCGRAARQLQTFLASPFRYERTKSVTAAATLAPALD